MDGRIQDLINGAAGHSALLDRLMELSANDFVYLAVPLLIALWFWPVAFGERALNQRLAFATGLAIVLAVLGAAALGHLFSGSRPFASDPSTRLLINHEADNSFPSDHAAFAFTAGGAIVWWRRLLGAVALAFAALIAVARVYVDVHWPSDVVAGTLVGLIAGALGAAIVPWLAKPQRWCSRFLPTFLLAT